MREVVDGERQRVAVAHGPATEQVRRAPSPGPPPRRGRSRSPVEQVAGVEPAPVRVVVAPLPGQLGRRRAAPHDRDQQRRPHRGGHVDRPVGGADRSGAGAVPASRARNASSSVAGTSSGWSSINRRATVGHVAVELGDLQVTVVEQGDDPVVSDEPHPLAAPQLAVDVDAERQSAPRRRRW